MAELSIGTFTHWKLSDQELLQGGILSPQQKQLIQNDLATTAEQILNLVYDPTSPLEFVQQDANFKGYMQALRAILARSDEAEVALRRIQEGVSPTVFDNPNF